MGLRVILVRHGETEANRQQCFAHSEEIPLTDTGRQQALEAAKRLAAEFRPRRLLSSRFARARETSQIIGHELGLAVEILDGIHERDFGCLMGHPYPRMGEMMTLDPSFESDRHWLWRPEGGESLEDVRQRAVAVLDGVISEARSKGHGYDVVVVCHGAVIQAISAHLTGNWTEASIPENCGVVVIEPELFDAGRVRGGRL